MLVPTSKLLQTARQNGYAVGAFNVYNLEGGLAVVAAAEKLNSPAMLQVLPRAFELGGTPLVSMCREACRKSSVPMALHLDHCPSEEVIGQVLEAGISSVMADGSHLDYEENIAFTTKITKLAHQFGCGVEAELGRLSGSEDGLTVEDYEAKLTDPEQAADFVFRTRVDALAVCIGNVHGHYHKPPELDFDRMDAVRQLVSIPLVLHGTSGLPNEMILQAIELGVCKFNVNTEIRETGLQAAHDYFNQATKIELVDLMESVIEAMQVPIMEKIKLFGSAGRAN